MKLTLLRSKAAKGCWKLFNVCVCDFQMVVIDDDLGEDVCIGRPVCNVKIEIESPMENEWEFQSMGFNEM
jgi:hypothetical protein